MLLKALKLNHLELTLKNPGDLPAQPEPPWGSPSPVQGWFPCWGQGTKKKPACSPECCAGHGPMRLWHLLGCRSAGADRAVPKLRC